jgi:hypothetical protein
VSGPGSTGATRNALKWDDVKAKRLFAELRDDRPV